MVQHDSAAAYDAARHRSAFVDRSHLGRIVVSGSERASYLQGLLTNDIVALKAGHGCYAAYLTAQGRMIADLHVYELGDAILLTVIGAVKDVVLAKLDQFIFSEDVQLGDVTDTFAQVAVVGPGATASVAAIVIGVSEEQLRATPDHGNLRSTWTGGTVIVTRVVDTGEPGFDLYVDRAEAGALKAALITAGAVELDDADAETLRIEAGVPLFGRDMDEETIPLEAGIESQAISFTKGCYVGQEIIIRVLHRGHGRVARKLVGLTVVGDRVPVTGEAIHSGDREIGRVTSAAMSPALARPIALGYVQRDFVDPGTSVTIAGQAAAVTALPFVGSDLAFRAKREKREI
jgi:folate-binding protein YgfZ